MLIYTRKFSVVIKEFFCEEWLARFNQGGRLLQPEEIGALIRVSIRIVQQQPAPNAEAMRSWCRMLGECNSRRSQRRATTASIRPAAVKKKNAKRSNC
ncbi:hypothetical protein NG798_27450 [Ancylothrix sp. C2]|uniref:hypothetical protein n=1 Tax=Ancylothrix sp. D3o TaxID=2953691 RepID=UPI0021BB2AF1|nr:hypothetical protein [Ancylothrix sp. D3o]MCT7953537.1 hypothetical protein [Ancylothrix sp. D3o]